MMSKKEARKAQKVMFYQELIGWPATESMTRILENGVRNTDVNGSNEENAEVLGEPAALPKGKMTRKHPTPHKTRHNKKSDPLTKAGNGQHHQSKYIKTRKVELVVMRLKEHIDYYRSQGLVIGGIHVDNKFDNDEVRAVIGDAILHVYAKDEHVQ
eukprot:4233610-Ditylum_brightwellii.AAC.1